MNRPGDVNAMGDGAPLERHGPTRAGGNDPLEGVDRQRHRGESSGQHAVRILRELAEAKNSKERAGTRRPCSLCTGPLEDVCGLFEASRSIRRTDRRTDRVVYLGPRWYCCRECSALLRAVVNREELGGMAALGSRFVAAQRTQGAADPTGELLSEFLSVVVELTGLLEVDAQIVRLVPSPKWGPVDGQ